MGIELGKEQQNCIYFAHYAANIFGCPSRKRHSFICAHFDWIASHRLLDVAVHATAFPWNSHT